MQKTGLVRRGGTFHLVRRVPKRYAAVESRMQVWISLHTDSETAARQKAVDVWGNLIEAWETKLAGDTQDAEARFEAARELARIRGFRYLPVHKVAKLPREEWLQRMEAVPRRNGDPDMVEAAAILGGAPAPVVTFEKCARDYIADHASTWSHKHGAQWPSTLRDYVYPVFGHKPIQDVDIDDVLEVLKPIWLTKSETAGRVRGRIARILEWAKARGLRTGDNPAAKDGPLVHLLPPLRRAKKVKPHKAVPYREVSDVVKRLRELDSVSARALLFTILTAVRTDDTLGATWDEFDLEERVWTIPADRTKGRRKHRVPLSEAAIDVLAESKGIGIHVFPAKGDKKLSNMAMLQCLKGVRKDGVTVHGFRASFSTWAREQTDYPLEVIEAALAHKQRDAVIAAYARTTFFDKRRELMAAWASHCSG